MEESFGLLELTYPDGRSETVPLLRAVMRVGRGGEGNDLSLGDDQSISRQHAQFLYKRGQLRVVSLSSAGVVVDGVRLGPNEAADLSDGSSLLIGLVQIVVRLSPQPELPRESRTRQATAADTSTLPQPTPIQEVEPTSPLATPTPAPGPPALVSPTPESAETGRVSADLSRPIDRGDSHLRLRLADEQLDVRPGHEASITAVVEKRFGEVDRIRLSLEGVPASWYSVVPSHAELYPADAPQSGGEQPPSRQSFTLKLHPPAHPSSAAGTYDCRVVAHSEARPGEPAEAGLQVAVQSFHHLQTLLSPAQARGRRGRFQLAITNESNVRLPVQLSATDDRDGELLLALEREELELEPGASTTIALTAQHLWRWPFGRPGKYLLTAQVAPLGTEPKPQTSTAKLTLTRLPGWLQLIPLLLLIGAVLTYLLLFLEDWRPQSQLAHDDLSRGEYVLAQAVPRELQTLTFQRDGVIEKLCFRDPASPQAANTAGAAVALGPGGRCVGPKDQIEAGTVLAELRYYEQLLALRKAEDGLERAMADLEAARRQQDRVVELAELDLQQAQNNVARQSPGGPDDPARAQQSSLAEAQRTLSAAQREATSTASAVSAAKHAAEAEVVSAAEAIQAAQERYSIAYWENDWVEQYGTDPNAQAERSQSTTGEEITVVESKPVKLNSVQRQAFKDVLAAAERDLRAAERGLETARRALDIARADEISQNAAADEAVQIVQSQIETLAASSSLPNPQLAAARIDVERAEIAMETTREVGLEPYIKAVEAAQAEIDDARLQLENRSIRAPADGIVVGVTASVNSNVQADTPVLLFAVGGAFELAAELTPEQLAVITRSPEVTATLVGATNGFNSTVMLRQLPLPALDPGTTQAQAARFTVVPELSRQLHLGVTAKLWLPLEQRLNALVVRPPFLLGEGERRYLLLREPACSWSPTGKGLLMRLCERRVYVRPGMEADGWVELRDSYDEKYSLNVLKKDALMQADPAQATPARLVLIAP